MRNFRGSRVLAMGVSFWAMGALAGANVVRGEEAEPVPGEVDTLGTPQEEEETGPNRGRVHLSIGSDIVNAYFFRGILQERDGFIWQPSGLVSVNFYSGDGVISSWDGSFGVWTSVQTDKTLASGSGPSNWYEADIYPGMSLGFNFGLTTSLSYVNYTYPNGAFPTVQELDWGLAYDDSELLGAFSMAPTATLAFELDNTALGTKKGGYCQLSLTPHHDFDVIENYPITVAAPLNLGLSIYDYYEDPNDNSDTFGFFNFGLNVGIPLPFIPEEYGSLSTKIGITVYVLSSDLEFYNEGDEVYPVGTWTLAFAY